MTIARQAFRSRDPGAANRGFPAKRAPNASLALLSEETEIHGWLLPADEPTPRNGCAKPGAPSIPREAILFIAGTAAWTESQGKSLVLHIGDSNLLFVQREGPRLAFDADIFNKQGNLVVRITENEPQLIYGEYSYRTATTVEVRLLYTIKKALKSFMSIIPIPISI